MYKCSGNYFLVVEHMPFGLVLMTDFQMKTMTENFFLKAFSEAQDPYFSCASHHEGIKSLNATNLLRLLSNCLFLLVYFSSWFESYMNSELHANSCNARVYAYYMRQNKKEKKKKSKAQLRKSVDHQWWIKHLQKIWLLFLLLLCW